MIKKRKIDADTWLKENLESVVDKYGGRYVVIVNDKGIVFTDKDGTPSEIVRKARTRFPKKPPLFFRVPRPRDFLCVLDVR